MIPKTKIIATLGPASNTEAVLRKMYLSGLDIVRLNFSHGNHQEHLQRVKIVRMLNKKLHRAVKIMQDLEGYRLRVGKLKEQFYLKKGEKLYLTQEDILGDRGEVSFDYKGSLRRIKKGFLIHIDDGRITLRVLSVEKKCLKTRVVTEGQLRDSKGINIPEAKLEFEALTDKDKKDVKVAIAQKFDYIAQSFVSSAKDLKLLKNIVLPKHPKCKFYAKVESRIALVNLDEIINEADGIIVARGDLGICVPIYKVPTIQKEIVKKCHSKNKPVVVATQMLDSMTDQALPTRAEVSDVTNAILDGATHLLLSAETAVGRHPQRVVDMMNKVIKNTESYQRKLKDLLK
ncbi:MAG: pyruvate kinase [Candidatus Omnitrophica bacterium]|nr:pyruvate kinase [Candidatus Omnitrophota bacterium]